MADKAWKKFEREVASYLGGRRIPVAEDGQQRGTLGDIELTGCLISCRLRAKGSAESWWWQIARLARAVGKIPVVIFRRPRHKGVWALLSMEDVLEFAYYVKQARGEQWVLSTKAAPTPKPPEGRPVDL